MCRMCRYIEIYDKQLYDIDNVEVFVFFSLFLSVNLMSGIAIVAWIDARYTQRIIINNALLAILLILLFLL